SFVVAVGGGDREDALVGGGVGLLDVASGAVVARGGDDDDLPGQGLVDGGLEVRVGFGGVGGVLADVDDLRLGLDGVADALGEGAGVAVAVGVVLLDGDDGCLGGGAREAGLVGGPGGDDAGDLGAVADGVGGAVLLAAVDGVAVVVLEALGQEVAAALGVDRALELRVAGVDAGVDDGDAHALALGLGPQRVELDALEGPGAAGVGGVGVFALVGEGVLRGGRRGEGDRGGQEDRRGRRRGRRPEQGEVGASHAVPRSGALRLAGRGRG